MKDKIQGGVKPFIGVMKDKIQGLKGCKSFIGVMKDKIQGLKGCKALHRGYEVQNSRTKGL